MSFRLKTIVGVASIEALLLLFMIWTSLDDLTGSNERELIERAETAATLFATTTKDAVLATDLASLESFVAEILKNPGMVYARIIDADGVVLAEGGSAAALADAFEPDAGLDGVDDNRFDTVAEIREGEYLYGRVELAISTDRLWGILGAARQRLVSIAAIELVLVAIFSLLLGVYLTRQLKRLQIAAERIADGQMENRVEISSKDEIGRLASAFNVMSTRLKVANDARDDYERELEALNRELEDRVARRTESLAKANRSLMQANDKLRDAQRQLVQSEKLASLGQLAAGVAHEINNPLSFVNANLSSLKDYLTDLRTVIDEYTDLEGKLPAESKARINTVKDDTDFDFVCGDIDNLLVESIEGTDRVRKIVLDLKNYSRVDTAEWQEVDLHDCIRSTLNIASNEIKYKADVQLELGDIPNVYCIASEINQVLMNLMINGAQAIDDHGKLTITTGCAGDDVWVDIEDTGSGMDEATRAKIFDPFFTTKPVGKGTGLGLAICHRIVDRHHGRIEVKSVAKQGTRFRVWLPIQQIERDSADDATSGERLVAIG